MGFAIVVVGFAFLSMIGLAIWAITDFWRMLMSDFIARDKQILESRRRWQAKEDNDD
jgi:hypothetical protein